MIPPGTPSHHLVDDGDERDLAVWMLALIDESPDRLAFISIPQPASAAKLDAIEERVVAAYEIAKQERPEFSLKIRPQTYSAGSCDTAVTALAHEHRWVGGACIHGCGEHRPVDDGPGAA